MTIIGVSQARAQKEVKKFGFMWKRSKDKEDLDDVLKNVASMVYELRTTDLTPKQYYSLFTDVTNQMHGLDSYFQQLNKKGMPMEELYRRVQETPKVLPRMYMLAVAGAVYISSKEAAAKHILKDLVEMAKGVQHPMRALFLRNFINQQVRNYLPDVDNEYSGEGGNVFDSIEFVLQNFTQMNKLWVRMQTVGGRRRRGKPLTEQQKRSRKEKKAQREAQRKDLKILVGLNLQRLGSLDGVDVDVYTKTVLPDLLEQITNCRDTIAQEYLMDLIVHGFPCEYHLRTLDLYLQTCAELKENVNVAQILKTFMNRLGEYASEHALPKDVELFKVFDSKVKGVIDATEMELDGILELKHSQLGFALGIATSRTEQLVYAGHILKFCASLVTAAASSGGHMSAGKETKLAVELLSTAIEKLSFDVLNPEVTHFGVILKALPWAERKQVAIRLLQGVLNEADTVVNTPALVTTILTFAMPIVTDENDAPGDHASSPAFVEEQIMMAKLIQRIESDDPAVQFKMYHIARKAFGKGGTKRIKYTLLPLVFCVLKLIDRVKDAGPNCGVKLKKLFQFIHDTMIALASNHADHAVRLFLQSSLAADRLAADEGGAGFSAIAYEFIVQALILYEEMANSKQKKRAITEIIGTLYQCVNFSEEEFENLVTRVTQHAAKLIKKPDQCQMVQLCCHLFWTADKECKKKYEDTSRVLACLQRCLKIADKCMGDHTHLFVEILNSYLYFYQNSCPSIKAEYISGLIKLINANSYDDDADDDAIGSANGESKKATEIFFRNTLKHIKALKAGEATAAAFEGLSI